MIRYKTTFTSAGTNGEGNNIGSPIQIAAPGRCKMVQFCVNKASQPADADVVQMIQVATVSILQEPNANGLVPNEIAAAFSGAASNNTATQAVGTVFAGAALVPADFPLGFGDLVYVNITNRGDDNGNTVSGEIILFVE